MTTPILTIVANPDADRPDLRSVSQCLRNLADNIDSGEHGEVLRAAVVDNGTTVASLPPLASRRDITTTGLRFTISEPTATSSKSQTKTSPGLGWYGSGISKKKAPRWGLTDARASLESPIRAAAAMSQAADSSRLSPDTD